MKALDDYNAEHAQYERVDVTLLGPLHEKPENAANQKTPDNLEHATDLNAIAFMKAQSAAVAGDVRTYRQHLSIYADPENKAIQARMWLISFTDLFSLMLCFFLMLYSMKDPMALKSPILSGAHATQMHGGAGSGEAGQQTGQNIARVGMGEGLNLGYLQGVLKNALVQVKLENDVRIITGADHLKLHVDAEKLFYGNTLSADGQRIAKGLANRLATLTNRITVVGVPSDSAEWSSSLAQGAAFAEMMRDAGYRKPFVVVGDGAGGKAGIEIRVDADDGRER